VVARTPTITRLDRASSALPFSSLGYLILASASALLVFLLHTPAAFLHAAIIFGVSLYCLIFPTPARCTTSCLLRLLYFALHITKPHLLGLHRDCTRIIHCFRCTLYLPVLSFGWKKTSHSCTATRGFNCDDTCPVYSLPAHTSLSHCAACRPWNSFESHRPGDAAAVVQGASSGAPM
jgi:hypothetical protein